MDYTKLTLGELLSHKNDTIKRNAVSIMKTLQKSDTCPDCFKKDPTGKTDCARHKK